MVPGPSSIGIPIVDEKKEEDEEKEEIKSPQHKIYGGSMPQSGQKPDNKNI